MKYKHIETGAIINSSSKIIGKAWEPVEDKGFKEDSEVSNKVEEPETNTESDDEAEEYEEVELESLTKQQLIDFAKENEIEVNERDAKAVIIEKIAEAFE